VNGEPDGDLLACGRLVEDVLAQVAEGRGADRDAHQRQCPHCQAALAEYDRLWIPIRELAAETVDSPEGVLERALRRIRGAVEHANYAVVESANGLTRISARVVAVTARETAQTVPGVRVALSKHMTGSDGDSPSPAESDGAGVVAGVAGQSTAIEITLAADYGLDLQDLGERVRAEVSARVRELTDLEPVQITVIIDDVLG
jgi:uncharacterized alkaline shock family protein YloU